jgi:DNA-binding MarR family transcriptional regulator
VSSTVPTASADEPVDDVEDVALASDLVVYASRLMRAVRRDLELPSYVRVLSLLDEHGPTGITQLAVADRCSQPTMSTAVAQLVTLGLVTKAPSPTDGRASVVTLTEAGSAELARVRRLHGRRVAHLVAAHPSHTHEELATAVAVLRDILTSSTIERGLA